MLLAIDLGNTNLTFGLFDQDELVVTFRAQTVRGRTADEYAAVLRQLLQLHEISPRAVDACILASVVPQLTDVLVDAAHIATKRRAVVVGPGMKTGIKVLYDNPHEVGADRVVNAVAVYESEKRAVIVVDFGTATTFDCITGKGEYLGGVIAPGLQLSLDALMSRAAKLRAIEIAAPPQVIGKNTTHSLQSGAVFGYACMVDGLVAKIKRELAEPASVIATGGLASLVAPHTESIERVDPNVTLVGLRILYGRCSK
ncbi:MAG: pantothenate kinase [Pseudomonadota bacterium]|jgi:type III pantothenate kinase